MHTWGWRREDYELSAWSRFAHHNQEITSLDRVYSRWIETGIAVRAPDRQDHDAELVMDTRSPHCSAGKRRLAIDLDLLDQHFQRAGTRGGNIEEIQHIGSQKALGNPVSGGGIGR